jgi:hypothetical protein
MNGHSVGYLRTWRENTCGSNDIGYSYVCLKVSISLTTSGTAYGYPGSLHRDITGTISGGGIKNRPVISRIIIHR